MCLDAGFGFLAYAVALVKDRYLTLTSSRDKSVSSHRAREKKYLTNIPRPQEKQRFDLIKVKKLPLKWLRLNY